jgi:branched-chain amino acid transport system substrate-binding protein
LGVIATVAIPVLNASSASAAKKKALPVINIGVVGTFSGTNTSASLPSIPTAKAWAAWVNAHGGIRGHKVKLFFGDDKGSPSTGLTVVQQLVQQDHVAVIAGGEVETTGTAWQSYVDGVKLPVIGGSGAASFWLSDPNFFSVGTTIVGQLQGIAKAAKAIGTTNMSAGYCAEVAECSGVIPLLQSAATAAGVTFTNNAQAVSASAPNYTAQCLNWQSAGDTYIFLGLAAATVVSVVNSCATQGYNPTYGIVGGGVDATLLALKSSTFDIVAPTFPWLVKNAVTATYRAALAKYAKGNKTVNSLTSTGSWASLAALQSALVTQRIGPGKVTAKVVTSAMDNFKGNLGGLLANPGNFTANTPHPGQPCFFTLTIKSGAFHAPNGLSPIC